MFARCTHTNNQTHTHTVKAPKLHASTGVFLAAALMVFYKDPNWEINAEKSIGLKFYVQ